MGSACDEDPPAAGASSGRRAWGSLSRAQIVAAALEIARNEGMHALTIRRLASDLGASRMALYRHVPDKNGLIDLVMNAIAEHDVVPPDIDEGPWQERLRRLADGMRRELAAYPGLVDILVTRANHGPGALRLIETVLDILADAGLDERQAARRYLLFIDLVLGRLHRELLGDPMDHHRTASLLALAEDVGDYPRLRAAGPYLREVTSRQVFDDEIAMLILAIESSAREA
ncbi:TetR/AcrR family transcriptional regulator [Streptomyces sp. NPDC057199]|uniref:TetR/AcrR family transcriptional regulator n=1 Tax=Streptomyces sp. NPDC057199 TaxID=3346047 RepID=UPI00363FCC6A